MRWRLPLALVATLGCASNSGPATTDTGTVEEDTAALDDTGAVDETTADADETSTKPKAPTLLSVLPMAANLHVTWRANDTGLTGVQFWRKKDGGAYAKVRTLAGTTTSLHDTGAVAPGTYCYQVANVRGTDVSDLSNEKCNTL